MRRYVSMLTLLAVAMVLISALWDCPAAKARTTDVKIEENNDKRNSREVPTEKVARGKRGRRLTRVDAWVSGLQGDKKRIYERHGHPTSRIRQDSMGSVLEKWTYSDTGRTFIFKGNKLVR